MKLSAKAKKVWKMNPKQLRTENNRSNWTGQTLRLDFSYLCFSCQIWRMVCRDEYNP